MSRDYAQQQVNQPKVNVNMQDSFDVNLFNKIYDENKIQKYLMMVMVIGLIKIK